MSNTSSSTRSAVLHFIGAILLITGFLKFIVGTSGIVLDHSTLQRLHSMPVVGGLFIADTTTAGRAIEISVICFGLYSILKGMYILDIYKHPAIEFVAVNYHVIYMIYGSIGLFLVSFYIMIVYGPPTSWISRDDRNIDVYKLIGIGSGLLFLAIGMLMFGILHIDVLTITQHSLIVYAFAFTCCILLYIIMYTYDEFKKRYIDMVTTAVMVVFGSS